MLLAFATVGVIELRTVLSISGVEVAASVYYSVAALVVALVVAALLLLPERDSGENGGPEGNPGEA